MDTSNDVYSVMNITPRLWVCLCVQLLVFLGDQGVKGATHGASGLVMLLEY
jgi:hypothetical protein